MATVTPFPHTEPAPACPEAAFPSACVAPWTATRHN